MKSKFLKVVVDTANNFDSDNAAHHGAALAFHFFISLPAVLFFFLAIASLIVKNEAARLSVKTGIAVILSPATAAAMNSIVDNLSLQPDLGLKTFIASALVLIALSGLLSSLRFSLNKIWQITPKGSPHIFNYLARRLAYVVISLMAGFVFLIVFLVKQLILPESVTGWLRQAQGPGLLLAMLCLIVLLFLLFKYLPAAKIPWPLAITAAFLTSLFLIAGTYVANLYLRTSEFHDAFGVAGTIIGLLIWIYYSALAVMLGAEMARAIIGQPDNN